MFLFYLVHSTSTPLLSLSLSLSLFYSPSLLDLTKVMFETVAEECGERKRENNQVNPQPDLLFKAKHFNPGAF
jgi:hypothetical protein